MSIEEDLIQFLREQAPITELVGTDPSRIAKDTADEKWDVPYIVLRDTLTLPFYNLQGESGLSTNQFEIACYDTTAEAAKELTKRIRTALSGYNGTIGSSDGEARIITSDSEFDDQSRGKQGLFVITRDYEIISNG